MTTFLLLTALGLSAAFASHRIQTDFDVTAPVFFLLGLAVVPGVLLTTGSLGLLGAGAAVTALFVGAAVGYALG